MVANQPTTPLESTVIGVLRESARIGMQIVKIPVIKLASNRTFVLGFISSDPTHD